VQTAGFSCGIEFSVAIRQIIRIDIPHAQSSRLLKCNRYKETKKHISNLHCRRSMGNVYSYDLSNSNTELYSTRKPRSLHSYGTKSNISFIYQLTFGVLHSLWVFDKKW
jgi:hypothetical protein